MGITSDEELQALKHVGRVVAVALKAMKESVQVGITTSELDSIGASILNVHGARSAPILDYGFPASTCISVNEEAVHGIPSSRVLESGDIVTLDVTAELNGFYADSAVTVGVGDTSDTNKELIKASEEAFHKAVKKVRAGEKLSTIGGVVEAEVEKRGFKVLRDLCGHGIGRRIHEAPNVANFYHPQNKERLSSGQVIALEPIISLSSRYCKTLEDKWTIVSSDGSACAHYEHTVVVTRGMPIIITQI